MDLYELIGVPRDAALDEIKRAYRRLARRYHPDINPGDRAAAVRFRVVADAYEILADPERRRQYDAFGLTATVFEGAAAFGFEGFDFSAESANGPAASTFGDLFADVIHETAGRAADVGMDGADLHASPVSRLRGRGARHREGHRARPAGHVRRVRGRRRRAGRREHVPGLPRRGHDPVAARPHGVRETVRAVHRDRPAAARGLRGLRRRGRRALQPGRAAPDSRGRCRRQSAACGGPRPRRRARRPPGRSVRDRARRALTRCSGGRATTCT